MSEVYDVEFEAMRLNQLFEKYLLNEDIHGELYFYASLEEVRLDIVTPFMSEEDYKQMKDSGFRTLLFELLDGLMIYRERCGEKDCRGGLVRITPQSIKLTWLGSNECHRLVEARRGWAAN